MKIINKFILWLILLLSACTGNPNIHTLKHLEDNKSGMRAKDKKIATKPVLVESFTDSSDIGRKTFNKIELRKYLLADSDFVSIKFFSKQGNNWRIKNEFHFPTDSILKCDPRLSDFNKDGFHDLTYASVMAARGANDVRKLFIYDNKSDKLIYIKNSEDYPNMLYNKGLNCIDALLVSGCNTTAFLKLEADSLREFASVDQCDSLTVMTYDKKGKRKILFSKQTNREDFSRFKDYNPLIEYGDKDLTSQ